MARNRRNRKNDIVNFEQQRKANKVNFQLAQLVQIPAVSSNNMSVNSDIKDDSTISMKESEIRDMHEGRRMTIDDQLTHDRLVALEGVFASANKDRGGSLDTDMFRRAVRYTMGNHLTDQELDAMFMKVDTNCDCMVDWDEYLSYMLLEYKEKDAMNLMTTVLPLPKEIYQVPHMGRYQRHHDTIVRIRIQPNISKHANNLYNSVHDAKGKYVTISKDGVINFWNMKLKNLRKHRLPPPKSHSKNIGLWVTDMACAPNLNMLVVSSTSGCIVFYDLTAYSFKPVLTLADLDICVTCMNYWVDPGNPSHAKLLWGDVRGNIGALEFDDCPSICFLQPTINKQFKARVEFTDLLKQGVCGVKAYHLPRVHQDLVIEVKYYHTLHECFISCCRRKETSLCLSDLRKKRVSYFKVDKGIQSFQYSARHNMIITAGKDAVIRAWNPYFPHKPVMALQGTKSPILYVFVHEELEHIYSVSQEKEIHIFDMNTQMCIQTLFRKWVPIGNRIISACVFNTRRQALVIGNNTLNMFEHKEQDIQSLQYVSHKTPVTHMLYNELFDQVVSAGSDSVVVVWDGESGERVIQFQAHVIPQIGGGCLTLEITAMVFDPTQRRLITAARDGMIKMWNHNNGGLLRQISIQDTKDITGIICLKQRIMTAGWNRRITIYVDSYEDESIHYWKKRHSEDITAMTYRKPSTIASGSYDGDILLWMFETGHVTLRLNVHLGCKPIALVQDITCSELDTDMFESEDDSSSSGSSDSEGSGSDGSMNEDEDEQMLKQFMAYNTHRASIAAPIPMMNPMVDDQSHETSKNILPPEILINDQLALLGQRRGSADRGLVNRQRRPSRGFGSTLETIPDIGALTLLRTASPADLRSRSSGRIVIDREKKPQTLEVRPHLENFMHKNKELDANNNNNVISEMTGNRFRTKNRIRWNYFDKDIVRVNDTLVKLKHVEQRESMSSIVSNNKSYNDSSDKDVNLSGRRSDDVDENKSDDNHKANSDSATFVGKNLNNNNDARFRLNELLRQYKKEMRKAPSEVTEDTLGDARARYDEYLHKNEASILKLVFLESRESDSITATLVSASSGGWIRFWAVEHTGGLIGQFNAAHHPGESVQSICVDKDNQYLFTGDTEGYIKVWDISDYCISPKKIPRNINKQEKYSKFPLITQSDGLLKRKLIKQNRFRPPPLCSEPDRTWRAPELLNSFKAHMAGITGIDYVDVNEKLVTCSSDCSVRMHTIYGQFIGIFGQETPWSTSTIFNLSLMNRSVKQSTDYRIKKRRFNITDDLGRLRSRKPRRKLPADIRSVASATTLRVLNDGIRPRWRLARNVLLVFLPLLKQVREKCNIRSRNAVQRALLLPEVTKQNTRRTQTYSNPQQLLFANMELDAVLYQLRAMEEKTYTSEILGMSYKPTMKHQPFPKLPKIRQFQNQCDVYSSLPFFPLAPIDTMYKPPDTILEILERQLMLRSTNVRQGARKWKGRGNEKKVAPTESIPKSNLSPSMSNLYGVANTAMKAFGKVPLNAIRNQPQVPGNASVGNISSTATKSSMISAMESTVLNQLDEDVENDGGDATATISNQISSTGNIPKASNWAALKGKAGGILGGVQLAGQNSANGQISKGFSKLPPIMGGDS